MGLDGVDSFCQQRFARLKNSGAEQGIPFHHGKQEGSRTKNRMEPIVSIMAEVRHLVDAEFQADGTGAIEKPGGRKSAEMCTSQREEGSPSINPCRREAAAMAASVLASINLKRAVV